MRAHRIHRFSETCASSEISVDQQSTICESRPPVGNYPHKSYQNNKRNKIECLYNIPAAAAADNLHRIQER